MSPLSRLAIVGLLLLWPGVASAATWPRRCAEPKALRAQKLEAGMAARILGKRLRSYEPTGGSAAAIREPELRHLNDRLLIHHSLDPLRWIRYRKLCLEAYEHIRRELAIPKEVHPWRGKLQIYFLGNVHDYHSLRSRLDESPVDADTLGYFISDPSLETFHLMFFVGEDEAETLETLVHEMVHAFARVHDDLLGLPAILDEGLAEYLAGKIVRHPTANLPRRHRKLCVDMAVGGRLTPLARLFKRDGLSADEYALAWSLVETLLSRFQGLGKERPGQRWLAFLADLRSLSGAEAERGRSWEEIGAAFAKHLRVTAEEFEREWRRRIQSYE